MARVKDRRGSAESYLKRSPQKHQREMAMIEEAFAGLKNVRKVLDAPCGVGRATMWFARQGYSVTGIDLGEAAVEVSREQLATAKLQADVEKQDIFHMHYEDQVFDAVLCFRLLHHFSDTKLREQLIAELCRVSANYIVISYMSPWSFTSLRRQLRYRLSGKAIKQYPSTLPELTSLFAKEGFVFHNQVHRSPLLHSLQLAIFKRR